MSFRFRLLSAALGIACLAAPHLASAADQPGVPKPALYAAVAAKATGGVCSGALSLSDLGVLNRYIDRFLEADREVSRGKPSEGIAAVVVTELQATYTKLRREAGGCSQERLDDAREQLRRISFHIERTDYWTDVRNPPPSAGDAIAARVIGSKCTGIFDVDQTALLNRFIVDERERLGSTMKPADLATHDRYMTAAEHALSSGWWFPWHCTRAEMSDAKRTLRRIEAEMAKRAQH